MKKHILPTAFILSAAAAIACASRPFDSHAPAASAPFAARTIAPDAATISAGASLGTSTSQIGGDLSPSHQKVEQEAQAQPVVAAPAGAFNDELWQLRQFQVAHETAALAQPPAPAMPVNAPAALPVAAAYTPVYPTYRPTFSGYVQQGSCGPNGCGPVRGWFGRRR